MCVCVSENGWKLGLLQKGYFDGEIVINQGLFEQYSSMPRCVSKLGTENHSNLWPDPLAAPWFLYDLCGWSLLLGPLFRVSEEPENGCGFQNGPKITWYLILLPSSKSNHGFLNGNSSSKPYLPGLNLLEVIRLMGPPHSILDARLLSALQLRRCSLWSSRQLWSPGRFKQCNFIFLWKPMVSVNIFSNYFI